MSRASTGALLVSDSFDPADALPHGNVRPGSDEQWELTDAGEAELDQLERLA